MSVLSVLVLLAFSSAVICVSKFVIAVICAWIWDEREFFSSLDNFCIAFIRDSNSFSALMRFLISASARFTVCVMRAALVLAFIPNRVRSAPVWIGDDVVVCANAVAFIEINATPIIIEMIS